jgi:hypothetical protein
MIQSYLLGRKTHRTPCVVSRPELLETRLRGKGKRFFCTENESNRSHRSDMSEIKK